MVTDYATVDSFILMCYNLIGVIFSTTSVFEIVSAYSKQLSF